MPALFLRLAVSMMAFLTPPDGDRLELSDGARLFIPKEFQARGGMVDVVVHLHGSPTTTEPALAATGWNAVLISFNRSGLSSAYAQPFADPDLLNRLLDETTTAVAARKPGTDVKLGRVVVSSFSAGFGGVRELLKNATDFERIDALVLADSLYCGYIGDPTNKHLDPELMGGFERFAREAAEGRKLMLLTHSAQIPSSYGSTTETADDLIQTVEAPVEAVEDDWGDGWRQIRRAERGGFLVLGFDGESPDDHLKHLRRIDAIWSRLADPFNGAR